jgi:hypothetical protein
MAEFTLFAKLPLELRRKIWCFAASTERIIDISWGHRKGYYYSSIPPPSVLHASRESRIEALRCYELLEMENCWESNGDLGVMFRTYISYQRDTLYLSSLNIDWPISTTPGMVDAFLQDFVLLALPPNDKLYRIALSYWEEEPKLDDHMDFLFQFPNLEVIYLVLDDRCCLDRNTPYINASHFTNPSHDLLNGEFRTSAKDVYEEFLDQSNHLIEMERKDSERPLSGNDFTAWKDARERQWRDLKVIPTIISSN